MFKKSVLILSCVIFTTLTFAQELYVPRDVKRAYKNKTRDKNGMPGLNYWQNKASYNIKINAAPPNKSINGSEEITYTNNSPDTLLVLNFKLYANEHKPGAARLGTAGNEYLTSGVHIDKYIENGTEKKWEDSNDGTNKQIRLEKPLMPKENLKLSIDWHYDMSEQSGREGAIDSTTFFLAYFYPRIAV
ncbi:MAG: M1 family peptidase, partial [Aquaticitalea sp.]